MTETTVLYNVPRGTAYLTSQQIIISAVSFAYYIFLFRILSLSQIGQVSLLAIGVAIFGTLTQMALPAAATRFISSSLGSRDAVNAGAVASTVLRFLLVVATPTLLLASVFSPWIGALLFNTSDTYSLWVTAFATSFLLDLTTLYGSYFLGLGLYAQVVYQNLLYIPLSRTLGLILAYSGLGVFGVVVGWLLGAVATLLLSLYLFKGRLPSGGTFPKRQLLSFSLPVFASAIVVLFQSWGDIGLLQTLVGQLQVTGAYYLTVSSAAFLSIFWGPASTALYPSLSSAFSSQGPKAVSDRLSDAFRLVNVIVLPLGVSLASVAPTALEIVYGPSLAGQAVPFALLTLTVIFSAQGAILVAALQAVGRTKPLLKVYLVATILDLLAVALLAKSLGTSAGAIGRVILGFSIVLLAYRSLRPALDVSVTHGLFKAVLLAVGTGIPLLVTDQVMTHQLLLMPLFRLPAILGVFVASFLITSRTFAIFGETDFTLLKSALPIITHRYVGFIQRLLVREEEL